MGDYTRKKKRTNTHIAFDTTYSILTTKIHQVRKILFSLIQYLSEVNNHH
jgi:hypothetical protein